MVLLQNTCGNTSKHNSGSHRNSRWTTDLVVTFGFLLIGTILPSLSSFRVVQQRNDYSRSILTKTRCCCFKVSQHHRTCMTGSNAPALLPCNKPSLLDMSTKGRRTDGVLSSLLLLFSSLNNDDTDDYDDELGIGRSHNEDEWSEEQQQKATAETRALRNILDRFRWTRKDNNNNVRLIQLPSSDTDTTSITNNSMEDNKKQQLPQWLRDQQEERNRIRQIQKDQKRHQSLLNSTMGKTKPLLSTTGNIQNLMKGMPSLDDMFGVVIPKDDDATAKIVVLEVKEEQHVDVDHNDNTTSTTVIEFSSTTNDTANNNNNNNNNLPHLSSADGISRDELGQRMKLLLHEVAEKGILVAEKGILLFSSPSQYNYSAAVEATFVEAANNTKDLQVTTTISDQQYRSFKSVHDNNNNSGVSDSNSSSSSSKRRQFENFQQREQQLRIKMGLTGSLFEKEQRDKVEWTIEQEAQQKKREQRIANDNTNDKQVHDEISTDNNILPKKTAIVVFDEYETDPSFTEWSPPSSTSINDARYRSFATSRATKDSKDAFEMFLKKEKEMRDALGLKSKSDDDSKIAPPDSATTPIGETKKTSNRWSEVEQLFVVEHSSIDNDDYEEEEEESYESLLEDMDTFKPKPMSIADQRFRSFAKQPDEDDAKKAQFKAYLKKEQEMRQKLGYETIDEADVIVDEEEEPHPRSRFYESGDKKAHERTSTTSQEEVIVSSSSDGSSKWSTLEELYATERSAKDVAYYKDDYYDQQEQDMKKYETYDNIASDLFSSSSSSTRDMSEPRMSSTTFSSFEARRKDLLENTELTVDELNLLFEFDPLLRLSTINKPDSAFGAIFRFEGCLVDTTELQLQAWTNTAKEYQFNLPDREEVGRALLMKPELAIRNEFYWTDDILESREVALTHHDKLQECFDEFMNQINVTKVEIHDESSNNYYLRDEFAINNNVHYSLDHMNATAASLLFPVSEGAGSWLHNIQNVDMPCSVISHLDSAKLEVLLNITGLSEYFDPEQRVSSCAGYTREEQECLGSALRMRRRPDHCVVFGSTPESSIRAREVEIKSISIMGLYPMYELLTADLTVASFEDLSVLNVRRVFSDISFEPEVQLELERPLAKPRAVRTWIEGDRN